VAPALANALEDATGIRYRSLPFSPERIYRRLQSDRLLPASSEVG
jgi:CO/xanthine dehydrogenase Mo-binding subunit